MGHLCEHPAAFDGANIWVTNAASNTVAKLQATTGNIVGTFSVGVAPEGIGVAHADRLPSLALTADAGSMALIFSHIFTKGGF